jgi:4-amino-4-deoxy-L-arabinose transferase-like glycosyltransferase
LLNGLGRMNKSSWIYLILIVLLGSLFRIYGINHRWKAGDHYNYGGSYSMRGHFCLQHAPLSLTEGLPTFECEQVNDLEKNPLFSELSLAEQKKYEQIKNSRQKPNNPLRVYRNHPPTLYYGLNLLTSVFGNSEWVYRLWTLFFSVANIVLVFFLCRVIWPSDMRPFLAALLQAVFLGPIYFGTHVDYPSEVNTFFVLLSSFFALKERMWLAGFAAVFGGVFDWPGYFMFVPLLIYVWYKRKSFWPILVTGFLGVVSIISLLQWLLPEGGIVAFLNNRLLSGAHLSNEMKTEKNYYMVPFKYIHISFRSFSRLFSPLLASIGVLELVSSQARSVFSLQNWKRRKLGDYHLALLLVGLTGVITALVGYSYVMKHIFWYVILVPVFSLLGANFLYRLTSGEMDLKVLRSKKAIFIVLLLIAVYPYGIYQSDRTHDVINSAAFALTALSVFWLPMNQIRIALGLVVTVGLVNFSQVVNYRNHPAEDYEFCLQALKDHLDTGKVIQTPRKASWGSLLYCQGLPIQYNSPSAEE